MSETPVLRIECQEKRAFLGSLEHPCRIGLQGFTPEEQGKEGDKKTPLGRYHLRWGFYRSDKLPKPPLSRTRPLNWLPLHETDGWSDDTQDKAYNRFIRLPSKTSHEKLWRNDGAYDLILVLSHNDSPPQSGKGSAVFIHVAQPDDRNTLGCVAFAPNNFVALLPRLQQGMRVELCA